MISPVPSNDYQKRRQAMKSRLVKLGKDNPVVSKAVKMQEPPEEDKRWKNWEIVDELVSAARREYFDKEGGNMSGCLVNLSKALSKLASQKGIDSSKNKVNNDDSDEDY